MAKRCSKCLQWKSDSDFYRDKTKTDGLKSQCKTCQNQYKRDYRSRLQARECAVIRRSYKSAWLPKHKPYIRIDRTPGFERWLEKNKARRRQYLAAYLKHWHAKNPEASRTWYQNDRPAMIANRQSLRADKMSIPVNNLSIEEWQWMLETYDHRCVYCGKPCETLTPDHVVPLARGGANVISNIVPACPACNQRKNARTPEEANMPFVVNVDITNQLEQLTFI